MESAQQFFYKQAGYSYNPLTETPEQGKERTAHELAQAEEFAAQSDYGFEWEQDDNGCECDLCDDAEECDHHNGWAHETLGCVMRDEDGKVLQSLWGICSPSADYARVVEAELALEQMHVELSVAR